LDTAPKRIFGLDMVRAIAISMVVISHSIEILLPLRQLPVVGYPFGKLIALTYPFGVMGVELFFALSGFLIGGILIREFITNDAQHKTTILHFWKMRWLRTLPAYYTVLLIVYLLNKFVYLKSTGLSFLFFTQNLWTPHPPTFGEAWSLSIEEWSYLILPFLFWLSGKGNNRRRRLLISLVVYLSMFVLLRIANAFDPIYPNLDKGIRKVVMFRLDAVAWGMLMAYLHHFYTERIRKNTTRLFLIGLIGVVTISGLDYVGTHPSFNYYHKISSYHFLMDAFLYTLYPVFFTLILPYAYYIGHPKNRLFTQFITKTSILSYSLYLTHGYIILHLMKKFFFAEKPMESIVFFIVYILISILSAITLNKFIEMPFLKLREKIK
jgi:peptidoglycan/LPS O-acetylase OafA/YrhL